MTKMFRLSFSVIIAAMCIFGGLLTLNTQSAHAASKVPVQSVPLTRHAIPQWATKADPYVHVLNYVAYIDSAISKHLSATDVARVKSSVHYYNSLSLKTRQFHGTVIVPKQYLHSQAAMSASCDRSIYIAGVSWTGAVTVHLGYCLALEVALGEGTDAFIAGFIAAIFPPALPIAASLALYLGVEGLALGTYASECGDGAYFNFMLWNPAIFWPSPDC